MGDVAAPESRGVLEGISRNIAVIGSIIAALVGMNTALTTCSAQTVARHQTFRQAIDAEENYWRNLYNDYLAVFRQDVNGEERSARLFALSVLAQRDVPDFSEYSFGIFGGSDARKLARERLTGMKNRLNEVLVRPESSDPALARQRQEQSLAAVESSVRSAADRSQSSTAPTVSAPSLEVASGVNYLPQVLTRGDPRGWDMDVFWCGGGGPAVEAANYAAGLQAARAVAEHSASGGKLRDDRIGRVRLVMLPESRQGTTHRADGTGGRYPQRGHPLAIHADAAETTHATALRDVVRPAGDFRVIRSGTGTNWYMSLFSCAAQAPAPSGAEQGATAETAGAAGAMAR